MAKELRFPVEIDDSKAAKELNKLESSIGRLKDKIAKNEAARNPIVEQLKEAQTAAEKAQERVEELKSALADSEYKTSPGGVTDPDTFYNELQRQAQIKAELAEQEKILQEKGKAAKKLQAQDAKLQTTLEQQTAELEQQKAKAQELAEKLSAVGKRSSFKETLTTAVSGMKNRAKSLLSGEMNGAVKDIGNSFGNSLKRLLAFGIGIRSLYVLFNKLRKYITDSIQTFAQYDTETQASINNLKSALQGLKLQWGAAFAPVLNTVAPILQTLISWLNTAAQAIAQFMATLTGKGTFKRAIANTGQLSSNLGSTADNAKEAKKQLMGIDELNVLSDTESSSGGSGSGGATDGSFENVIVDTESLPAKIAEALKAGEWSQAATLLTDKLNKMVSSADWAGIGSKIGYYFNGTLAFFATALTTFDWAALAGSLAILLSNLISSVDWTNLAILFTAKFHILLLSAVGFLLNFDWGTLASGLSQFVIGFLNGLTSAISSVDWANVGLALWTSFKDIIENIDWISIGTAAINLLGAGFVAAAALLGSFIGTVVNDIVTFFSEFDADAATDIVQGFLEGIVNCFAGIGAWIEEHIFEPFVKAFKEAFGIHSPSTVMKELGQMLIAGLLNGLKEKWTTITSFFSETLPSLKSRVTNGLRETIAAARALDWASIGNGICNGIINGINAGWEWLQNTVANLAASLLNAAKSMLGIHSPSKVFRDEIGANIGAGIEEGIDDSEGSILQSIKGISADMLSSFSNVPSSLASRFTSMTLPPMPAVAMGTVVPPNTTTGSYGGISTELESKLDALLDRLNGGSIGKIAPSDVYLDKRKVGEIMYTYTEERNRGRGK